MFRFDASTESLIAPIWAAAAMTAVLVVLAVVAFARSGLLRTLVSLLVLALAGYGAWLGWLVVERTGNSERVEEKRAFERRVSDLTSRTSAPGSVLSCLEGIANEALVAGCERVVFENPENVAAVLAFTSARINLLRDGIDMSSRAGLNLDSGLNILRRGLEADRFGAVAYLMGQQPECLPSQCEVLGILRDANRVRMNLQDKPFEALVAKYSPQWSQSSRTSAIDPNRNTASAMPAPPAPVSSKYDLPSAASIPPVSIMNTEPGQSATTAPAASPVARARPPAARAPARHAEPPPPVPLAPSAAANGRP
jgi:hypothetical protein